MKKLIVLALALILAFTLTACGGNSGGGNNTPSQSTNSSDPASSQQQTPSEASAPQESGAGAAADVIGGKLADAYIGMFSGGTYYMKYRTSQEVEGEKMDVVLEMAVSGDDTAMITQMQGVSMHMIFRENKMYMVNHEEKTVMVMQTGSAQQQSSGGALPRSGFVFKGTGTGELFGTPRPYEEYGTDGGDVRYFFDGGKLVGIESSNEGITVQMEILEMSENIPAGMFDIPDGYEVIEY